jgi:hypothetical protein
MLWGNVAGTGVYTDRWRYITATDDPVIWVAVDDATQAIRGTWAADDPAADGGPGLVIAGCTSMKLTAQDLERWSVLSPAAGVAADYIRDRKLRMQHQAYRALQLLANDAAPARWLLDHCEVKNGAVVVKTGPR